VEHAGVRPGHAVPVLGRRKPLEDRQDPNTDAILKIDLHRARPTFGQIVASYPGNVDQYASALQQLSQTPACEASADPAVPYPLDDPVCVQLDLDFGAAANLFKTSDGRELVGDLQKSGVYHVADAATMKPAWTALVGASCQACNAGSTAVYRGAVEGVGTPGGRDVLARRRQRSDQLDGTSGRRHPLPVDERGRRRRLDG
jgi:hypothetical protein